MAQAQMAYRAPKPWTLKESESAESLESWWNNQKFNLSCYPTFATFIADDAEWHVKGVANRGMLDDVDGPNARTAAQKCTQLNFMLEQLSTYIVPIISNKEVVDRSTSLAYIYSKLRAHYGIQPSGARFIDFYAIRMQPEERYETLFQRLLAFVDESLLTPNCGISHHGAAFPVEEMMSPTIENMIVLRWLELIHPQLPGLVKQKYATNLRAVTIASIKSEISLAIPALLEEINNSEATQSVGRIFNNNGRSDAKNQSSGYSKSFNTAGNKRKTVNRFALYVARLDVQPRVIISKTASISHLATSGL